MREITQGLTHAGRLLEITSEGLEEYAERRTWLREDFRGIVEGRASQQHTLPSDESSPRRHLIIFEPFRIGEHPVPGEPIDTTASMVAELSMHKEGHKIVRYEIVVRPTDQDATDTNSAQWFVDVDTEPLRRGDLEAIKTFLIVLYEVEELARPKDSNVQ